MRKVADSCRDEIMFFCSDNKGDRTKRGDQFCEIRNLFQSNFSSRSDDIISIFQKIDDDLLDQQRIHGNHIEITGYRDLDLIIRIAFADGGDCIEKHFFSDFRRLF